MSIINRAPVAGTRDFFPAQKQTLNKIIDTWKKVSKAFGFIEYDACVLEQASLYTRKGGDDIINEMFTFKDGSNLVALRPEMTPTVCNMILDKIRTKDQQAKWFSVPQCFRNETTTRGRKREFYQWNVDVFGDSGPEIEAELLVMIVEMCKALGLTSKDIELKVSDRRLLQSILEAGGLTTEEQLLKGFNIVDKLNKRTTEELMSDFKEIGLTQDTINNIYKLVSTNDISTLEFGDQAVKDQLNKLFELLKIYKVDDWVAFDASIVRGLSYYTGLVFEGFSKNGVLKRALCGGGRYDNLLSSYGSSTPIPAVGFGVGDVVITEILKDLDILNEQEPTIDYCIIPFKGMYKEALEVAAKLRTTKSVIVYHDGGKVHKGFEYANKMNALYAILVAPDEYAKGGVQVKDLRAGYDKNNKGVFKLIDDLF